MHRPLTSAYRVGLAKVLLYVLIVHVTVAIHTLEMHEVSQLVLVITSPQITTPRSLKMSVVEDINMYVDRGKIIEGKHTRGCLTAD